MTQDNRNSKTPDNLPSDPSRRDFLERALWVGGVAFVASVAYPVAKYLVPPPESEPDPVTVRAGKEEDVAPNTGSIFQMGRKPGLLIRTKDGELRAFIATCTHLDCTVQFRPDMEMIWCACHNGRYDLSGLNVSGPPPRPLTALRVDVREGDIYVSREQA